MEKELTCIINGRKTDVTKLFAAIKTGNKIEAVKMFKDISSSDLSTAVGTVNAILDANEMPEEISFHEKGKIELKFKGKEPVIVSGNKSGGCGASTAVILILAVLPCFMR